MILEQNWGVNERVKVLRDQFLGATKTRVWSRLDTGGENGCV